MTQTAGKSTEVLGRVEEPQKYAGYSLHDPLNQRIGKVEEVFVSEFGEPQYIRVTLKYGLFKRSSVLLPVETVAESLHYTGLVLQ